MRCTRTAEPLAFTSILRPLILNGSRPDSLVRVARYLTLHTPAGVLPLSFLKHGFMKNPTPLIHKA